MKTENYHHGAGEITYLKASALRKPQTKAEQKLWRVLRNRNLEGYKFRRQHALGPFIADFYCHEARLVIEIDGENHLIRKVKEYDKWREGILRSYGLAVIRFTNDEVFRDLDGVLKAIVEAVRDRLNPQP
jgi:very-short-patch-repair endonuclease